MQGLKKKLQIKDEYRGRIVNIPEDLEKELTGWSSSASTTTDRDLDFVVVFVHNVDELEQYGPKWVQSVRDGGLIWFAYPKKSSGVKTDITRDRGWHSLTDMGLRPVRQISISDVWSGLRFREASKVK